MAPKLKMRHRRSAVACRVKLKHVRELERYRVIARRWGYSAFSPFLRDLMDAAATADPLASTIPFRPAYADVIASRRAAS